MKNLNNSSLTALNYTQKPISYCFSPNTTFLKIVDLAKEKVKFLVAPVIFALLN